MYGPVFLRFTRDNIPVIYDENTEFEIGKAVKLSDGKDVAIIANGDTVRLAIEAKETLEKKEFLFVFLICIQLNHLIKKQLSLV